MTPQELVRKMREELNKRPDRVKPGAAYLREVGRRYLVKHDHKPGDLVSWKPGLKDSCLTDYGEPMVVLEVDSAHRSGPHSSLGTNNYNEPMTVRIGICVEDTSELKGFWIDGNRLEPYVEPPREDMPARKPVDGE